MPEHNNRPSITQDQGIRVKLLDVASVLPIAFLRLDVAIAEARLYGRRGHTRRSWRPTLLNSTGSIW